MLDKGSKDESLYWADLESGVIPGYTPNRWDTVVVRRNSCKDFNLDKRLQVKQPWLSYRRHGRNLPALILISVPGQVRCQKKSLGVTGYPGTEEHSGKPFLRLGTPLEHSR
eukprot:392870-Rhodomonas_salina.1